MADRDTDRGIYLVPVSGEAPRPIEHLSAPAEAHAPAFSPDGHRLAYARCDTVDQEGDSLYAERGSQGCHVMVVDIDDAYRARGAPRTLTRSSMATLGAITGRDVDDRLAGSIAAALAAAVRGARILRVHDVRETVDALAVWNAIAPWPGSPSQRQTEQ